MRTQPGQKWIPLVAEQYFTTTPPAFVWNCTMRLFPLAWISATDQFTGGHGRMIIKLLSFITVGNAHGPEIDQGELQRYLAEMTCFPTAWLSDAIEWQAIDAHSVRATLREADVTSSVVLHVNEQGQLTQVTADRYKEEHGHYLLAPWSAQCNDYQEVGECAFRLGLKSPGTSPPGSSPGFASRSPKSNTTNMDAAHYEEYSRSINVGEMCWMGNQILKSASLYVVDCLENYAKTN